ncbi:class I SAM-dependent methyltransferase [Marinobacter bohaiensis]|uniref:class I SAM-dependent methyltransferase n=1 Tax=Marinobacter bohaiensis TaxID=2201898 RepID=UPI000DAD3606|nr:class I SAM-dependent methyltransferase [Marinobacter bohaiensis]
MKLSQIVPWGRSLSEYRAMFGLTETDLDADILGCGDGPASFNAEVSQRGGRVVSVDPVYRFSADDIRSRIDEVYPHIMQQMRENQASYLWEDMGDVERLGEVRMRSMASFLDDYPQGRPDGRYVEAALPHLPFGDSAFDLALCSHFLFLYSEHVDLDAHLAGIRELGRVAREVRVYPLLGLDGRLSPHLEPVMQALTEEGWQVSRQPVAYQFQRGATEMLVARSSRVRH